MKAHIAAQRVAAAAAEKSRAPNVVATRNLDQVYAQARATGVIRLDNLSLAAIPADVFSLYEQPAASNKSATTAEIKWFEVCDLTVLSAAQNAIEVIPTAIVALQETLTQLLLSKNNISSLPHCIFLQLPLLRKLDLSCNKLTTFALPQGDALPSLVELNISSNAITGALAAMPHTLQSLDIANNKITAIGYSSLIQCQQLSRLIANNNNITAVESLRLPLLTHLELQYNNQLKSLPSLQHSPLLVYVDVSNQQLSVLPAFHSNGKSCVASVLANNNYLTDITSLMSCTALIALDVNTNKLAFEQLPPLHRLPLLRTLDLSNNDLQDVDNGFSSCNELQRLTLHGNPLRRINRSKLDAGLNAFKAYLLTRIVTVSGNSGSSSSSSEAGIESSNNQHISSAIREATNSSKLVLSAVTPKLTMMPEAHTLAQFNHIEICGHALTDVAVGDSNNSNSSLPLLRVLLLDHNKLTAVSSLLCRLSGITHLSLQHNTISTVSTAISALTTLRVLNLSHNKLTAVPAAVLLLSATLQQLLLSHNSITGTLPSFNNMTSLQELDVSNNQLSHLNSDNEWHRLPSLHSLHIDNNQLTVIPQQLGLCSEHQLRVLNISGNPQRAVSTTIITRGTSAVILYLKAKLSPVTVSEVESSRQAGTLWLKHIEPRQQQQLQQEYQSQHQFQQPPQQQYQQQQPYPQPQQATLQQSQYQPLSQQQPQYQQPQQTAYQSHRQQQPAPQQRQPQHDDPPDQATVTSSSSSSSNDAEKDALSLSVQQLRAQLDNMSISAAQEHALKKKLAMAQAALNRFSRQQQQQQ